MKFVFACFLLLGLACGMQEEQGTPIDKVVSLIKGLAKTIEKDGKDEQASYDKYACWVESTLERKASDIGKAKALIGDLNESIKKLKASIASHGAEIAQLNKDIAQNSEAQKEASTLRNKENSEYAGERTESEQCIGALEAGIKVLSGAGTKKAGFLQQLQQAQIMSIAMGVREAMQHMHPETKMSQKDLQVLTRFVENPSHFASATMSAAQIGQNPFGDYAPQSSQITGILQGMYDAMTADLEKDNAHKAESQKSFEELMATKKQEQATLTATLQKQERDSASKGKQLAEESTQRDDTITQLAADEKFFDETKSAAEAKATEWSTRTRLRTEELAGMQGAIQILSGGSKTFKSATTTFLQLRTVHMNVGTRAMVYSKLNKLAARYQSGRLGRLFTAMKTGGHFDKVMIEIDRMMVLLRKEEQSDIEHRDRCENGQNANANSMEDAKAAIKKTDKKLDRMANTKKGLEKDLHAVKDEIKDTEANMKKLLDLRNDDNADFKKALKDDADAVTLIEAAVVRLSKYYKENDIALSLVQKPEYTQDADKAPETSFSGGNAHQSESGGIVAILSMIKEDLQKEMAEGRADEAKAQAEYEKQSGALQDSLDAQTESKVSLEKELASLGEDVDAAEQFKNDRQGDLDSEKSMKKSLSTDCDWVKSNFDKRRTARKSEMDGLVDAKDFLAGVESGTPVLAR